MYELFSERSIIKWLEAIHSRLFKVFLVPSILDCGFFETFSSSVTEDNVVADKLVCSDSQ